MNNSSLSYSIAFVFILFLSTFHNSAWSAVQYCEEPYCGSGSPFPALRAANKQSPASIKLPSNRTLLSNAKVQPAQINVDDAISIDHTLDGTWDFVTGFFGFWHTFEDGDTFFVMVIGTPVEDLGNSTFQSNWDKQVFWIDIGDGGAPMHVAAEYLAAVVNEDTGMEESLYYCPNFTLREPGVDYSNTLLQGDSVDLYFYVNPETYEVVHHEIDILDENNEVISTGPLQTGDEVQSWTQCFDLDDPDNIYLTTMEEEYRTVQNAPVIYYSHLTPNVDFENDITNGLIDFTNIDLQFVLQGETSVPGERFAGFGYSATVKPVNQKWGNTLTMITNWVDYLLPGLIR